MSKSTFDVIIIGGGIIGCATSYYLIKQDNSLKVAVIEMDPGYERSSTTLSMANARIQFSMKENIQISQYCLEVFKTFEDDMEVEGNKPNLAYRPEGNLFLFDANGESAARKAYELQKSLECQIEWWDPEKIKDSYPIYDPKELTGGTFGPEDGHFDAYGLLMGYKAKARALGVEFITGEVNEILKSGNRVNGVRLSSDDKYIGMNIINCAGAWAADLAKTAGVDIPVEPVNRQVFALDPAVKPEMPLPLTVLPSGLYFRTEKGGTLLLGKSMEDDKVGFVFSWDDKRFMENLWLELAEFVPSFDTLKLLRGWGGLYAVNRLDSNAILGEWPELRGFYLANGFSGHGLQQAPAVGRYLTELIAGKEHVLNLSIFSPERILNKQPLSEAGLV